MSDWAQINEAYNCDTICVSDPEVFGSEIIFASGPASAATGTTNQAVFAPIPIQKPFVVAQLFCRNGTVVSGNVDMAVYNDQKNRLVSIGATAQAGTSAVQAFNITDTLLLPGLYYLGIGWSSATATFWRSSGTAPFYNGAGLLLQTALGAATLPNPAVWVTDTSGFLPIMGMTARATI